MYNDITDSLGCIVDINNIVSQLYIYMEFRKMLMITLYAEQKKKKDRFIEQSFRLCGRRRGWDVSREQHQNMYTI